MHDTLFSHKCTARKGIGVGEQQLTIDYVRKVLVVSEVVS